MTGPSPAQTPPARLARDALIAALPYARRYARALTGSQSRGDKLVAEGLRALTATDSPGAHATDARRSLYEQVTRRFDEGAKSSQADVDRGLSLKQRQMLLLTSLEELAVADAAVAIGLAIDQATAELVDAREKLHRAAAADVLIIEDEPIIAMDIEELVRGCGHRVVGVAASEREALDIAQRTPPGLILADINLGLGGDGISAVSRILERHQAPVIFVTAYPERVLTGEALEPAFVISKPFEPLMLAITTYQAVTGGVQLD